MSRWRTALLATTLAAGPLATLAKTTLPSSPYVTGPYVGLGGGYSLQQDIFELPDTTPYRSDAGRFQFGTGYVGAGDVGWGLFGNVFYQTSLPKLGINATAVGPYVSVGVLWTDSGPLQSNFIDGTVSRKGGTASNLDYQGIVGVGLPIQDVPDLKLTADYRFIGVNVNSGAVGEYFARGTESRGTARLLDAFVHQLTAGVAYAFFHPAPPLSPAQPTPMTVAQPTRTYLVFFNGTAPT